MRGGGPQFFTVSGIFALFRSFSQFPAIFRQLLFARPPHVRVDAPCVPCAEVLLLEASGGLGAALPFFCSL